MNNINNIKMNEITNISNEELSIDEIFNSMNVETNMLETRENIILCLAPHVVHTEIIHQNTLLNLYFWIKCYTELY